MERAKSNSLTVVPISTAEQREHAFAIRRLVFIEEQQVPEEIELDADDARAFHALALLDGQPVGTGRMLPHGDREVKIGRMAVLRELRGHGIGERILDFLMDAARAQGVRKAVLHAQLTAEDFYLKSGYLPVGGVFDEAGIAHRKMERFL
jgi:predicted GNAT family N-acyltransferase